MTYVDACVFEYYIILLLYYKYYISESNLMANAMKMRVQNKSIMKEYTCTK